MDESIIMAQNTNIVTIFQLPAQSDVAQNYRNYITAQNTAINPNITGGDFYLKSVAIAGITTGAVADTASYFVQMFPQYLTGTFTNIGLSQRGLSPMQAATYAQATLGTVNAPAATFTVQAGMQLNSASNGAIYEIIATTIINITNPASYNSISSICTQIGAGNQIPVGSILTFANPPIDSNNNPVTTLTVQSSIDGSNAETNNGAVVRILAGTQIPKSGSRITDYYYYVLDGNNYISGNLITDAITIPNNQFLSTNYNFGLFGVGGSSITDYVLNQGLLSNTTYESFNRTLTNAAITAIGQSVASQQLINITPYINTVSTQNLPTTQATVVTPFFQIGVVLATGYNLSTLISLNSTDQNNNPIVISLTVEQLIQREVRRAICQQAYGATQTLNTQGVIIASTILVSAIEQQLDYALGTTQYNGIYATILVDRQVLTYNSTSSAYEYQNIAMSIGIPNPPENPIQNYTLEWIYDIADNATIGYANILVQLVSL